MWTCVSNEFNVVNIIQKIIEVAPNGGPISTSNKEALQCRLHEILDGKRYLLVLDDVWNEEREKWDDLKTLLTAGASSGSAILVTTRSKQVASIMATLPSHDLESLNEEDSWKFFQKRAFGEGCEEQHEEFNKFGKIIVSKCAGLPLALKAMGGLMRSRKEVQDWRGVAENKTWKGKYQESGILPVLKLSYDELPSYSKQCFAFCAIFPQDHMIERETLIQLWMANDFIPTGGTMDVEDKGRYIFNELYQRSFFQEIMESEIGNGLIITCKMHDLMHDLAKRIAGKRCSNTLELNNPVIDQKEVQHLLIPNNESSKINDVFKKFPIIRTYLVNRNKDYLIFGDGDDQTIEKHSYLSKSSSLRALQFQSKFPIPNKLGCLKHVRYLDLSQGKFETLPETITTLYNLQTLKLSKSSIRELPEGMRYMINLRHLFLNDCYNLKRMPIGLGQLQLRTLTKYIADSGIGHNIGELNNLNLFGHLSLSGLEWVTDIDAKAANIGAKSNLYSLELKWGPTDKEGTTRNEQAVLESLTPHNELKYLAICGYGGLGFPEWMMKSLIIKNLRRLKLTICHNCAELPPVWQLPLLDNLYLGFLDSLTYVVGGSCMHSDGRESMIIFPNLKVLNVRYLPNLVSWHEKGSEFVQFPKLASLTLYDCPKLNTLPVHAPLLNYLNGENFREVIFPNFKVLESWHGNGSNLVQYPKLNNLNIQSCPKLNLHQISNLPMLFVLHIGDFTPGTEADALWPPKTLVQMEIDGFENVRPLKKRDNRTFQAALLRDLTLNNSNCFFCHGPTKLELEFWKCFAAVERLEIWGCSDLVFWPVEEFRSLTCLKKLEILFCSKFTGSLHVSSSQTQCGQDFLPQLKTLTLQGCPELAEVSDCSKSLKKLLISKCPKVSLEGLVELTNLIELEALYIWNCDNLRALPDGMEHLISLKELSISDCRGIESFPKGLQQRLSTLEFLKIKNCPVLERRCRHGGDYSHLISPIPYTEFSPEEEEKHERFFRRLLPTCECLIVRHSSDEESISRS